MKPDERRSTVKIAIGNHLDGGETELESKRGDFVAVWVNGRRLEIQDEKGRLLIRGGSVSLFADKPEGANSVYIYPKSLGWTPIDDQGD